MTTPKKRSRRIPPPDLVQDLVAQTLAMMAVLEHAEEVGDCLMWTAATTRTGYPICKPSGCGCTLVRRHVFALMGGVLRSRQPVATKCGERLCINPAHLVASTTSDIAQSAAARGAWSGRARGAKISHAKRHSASAKLTLEDARIIRLSSETGPVLAARYGVNRSLINGIKAGRSWKDYASPFAGLMR
jgi:hypothetical protein